VRRAPPGPAGEAYVLPKPQAGFLGKEGKEEKREKGGKRRERGGREREGAATGILWEGRHVAKYGTAGEYRLG